MSVQSSEEEKVQTKQAKIWRLEMIGPSKVKRVKGHTHYPVPGKVKASVKVSKEIRIFVHTKRAVDLNHHTSFIMHH